MWQRGVARVIDVIRDKITVACPHCAETHTHSRHSLGSKEVVTGCHTGDRNCRSYSIPDKR